jgi:hypothetical protein
MALDPAAGAASHARPGRMRRPFQGLARQGWWNLGFVVAGVLLAAYCALSIRSRGVFEYWGADYRAFRASAEVAQDSGYAAVYDLAAQAGPQRQLFAKYAAPSVQKDFAVIPTPYLPVFIVPMRFLLVLPPLEGWLAWTALQAAILLLYFRRIRGALAPLRGPSPVALFVALPAYFTLAFGQVNTLILIGVCEFLLALRWDKDLKGGLWLTLLMVKPQLLILILPALLIQRRWRVLAGAAVGCGAVAVASVLLAGPGGILALVRLWLGYTAKMPTTYPESMMNWRSFMLNLRPVVGVVASGWIALVGTVVSAATGILIWLRRRRDDEGVNAGTGIYAMTCVVAWHAHVHLALPLLGSLYALRRGDEAPADWLNAIILIPSLAFAIVGIFVDAGEAHRLAGTLFFAFNLALGAALSSLTADTKPQKRSVEP